MKNLEFAAVLPFAQQVQYQKRSGGQQNHCSE